MQSYTEIPETQTIVSSRALLLNNDKTALSCSSGPAFPVAGLQVGMLCYRTDQNMLYQLKDTAPTWVLVCDMSSGVSVAPKSAALSVPVSIGVGDTSKSFDGSTGVSFARSEIGVPRSTFTTDVSLENSEPVIAYTYATLFGAIDGALYSHVYSTDRKHQIFGDYRTGQIALRGKNQGVWQSWRTVLDSGNYGSYALPLTGGKMSGSAIGKDSGVDANYAFGATTQGGSFASMWSRRGAPFYTFKADSGSSYGPSLVAQYHHNGNWGGAYSLGVLNYGQASPGAFTVHHINDSGGESKEWTFDGANGNFTSPGNVTAYSDIRLKKDWSNLPADFIERLSGIKHGTYTRIDTGERQIGVSAQDLQLVAPEGVTEGEYLSVAYGNVALAAVVELSKRVLALEAELKALQGVK